MPDAVCLGGTRRNRAAVLGSPVAHSLSPALHRAAYADLGLDWTYTAIEVDEVSLAGFLADMDDSWAGLSLTMPLKEAVIDLLDVVDDEARILRSVNTVTPSEGSWRGSNTDVFGITESLRRAGVTEPPATATVLGAGATARSAIAALARLGAREVSILARRQDAARQAADLAEALGLSAHVGDLRPDGSQIGADLVISALPGDVGGAWADAALGAPGVLLDVSYHPWPTPLARAWGGRGVASGRDMLLWQAVEQVRMMTGRDPSPDVMSAALPE